MNTLTLTRDGHPVRYDAPREQVVSEDDLFRALRREYRWLGQINFTVLEHLFLCARTAQWLRLPYPLIAHCAMHDMCEAYTRDLPTGLKDVLPGYRELEDGFTEAIYAHFDLPLPTPVEKGLVKSVDLHALEAESWYFNHQHEAVLAQVGSFNLKSREILEVMRNTGGGDLGRMRHRDRQEYDEYLWGALLDIIDTARSHTWEAE